MAFGASLVAQMVKNLPAMQEIQVRSLGQDDPLEKGMAIHSSILTWKIPRTRSWAGYSPCSHKELDMTWQLTFSLFNFKGLGVCESSLCKILFYKLP